MIVSFKMIKGGIPMALEQEFQNQWEGLCNYVKSEILKANDGTVDLNRIQKIFESEKKKWFLPGQYNNAWFEKLKRTNPEVAQKFEDALKNVRIEPVDFKQADSTFTYIVITAVGVVVGFGMSRIFKVKLILSLLWTALGAILGFLSGNAVCSEKKNEMVNELCSAYEEQLKKAGEMLSHIVSQI